MTFVRLLLPALALLFLICCQILHSSQIANARKAWSFHDDAMTLPQAFLPRQDSPLSLSPRLEFFHIPKSGGSMFEQLAGTHNVTWGACHFKAIVLQSKKTQWKEAPPWPSCPNDLDYNQTFPRSGLNYWHMPLYMLPHFLSFDPYDVVHSDILSRPKRYFTVIRNPYDRIVSLYYYYKGWNKPSEVVNNATRFNEFVLENMAKLLCPQAQACYENYTTCHGLFACATQYDYIHNKQKQIIHYVLHYENLQDEFRQLSLLYGLNFTISNKPPVPKIRLLTAANLSDDSLRFINSHFRKDFGLGRGYEMLQPRLHEKEEETTKRRRHGSEQSHARHDAKRKDKVGNSSSVVTAK